MKTIKYLLLVITLITAASSTSIAQDINPLLYENTWQDNQTKTMYGYDITKIFGKLPNDAATYNYSPITAIGYKS